MARHSQATRLQARPCRLVCLNQTASAAYSIESVKPVTRVISQRVTKDSAALNSEHHHAIITDEVLLAAALVHVSLID